MVRRPQIWFPYIVKETINMERFAIRFYILTKVLGEDLIYPTSTYVFSPLISLLSKYNKC
jgi:hypothetical protein